MDRKHIPAFALHIGQRAYIEPARAGLPRGPKLEGELAAGEMEVSRWVFDLVRRGQAVAWSGPPEELSSDEIEARRDKIIAHNEKEVEKAQAASEARIAAIDEALSAAEVSHV